MKGLLKRRFSGASRQSFQSPLTGRYVSREMAFIWSEQKKFQTFRQLWLALAQAQHELGLKQVQKGHLDEMRRHLTDVNFEVAEAKEK